MTECLCYKAPGGFEINPQCPEHGKGIRTCATCACSHAMKHPQLLNQTQMVCRRNGLMLATMNVQTADGPRPQQGLMYALTQPEAVCFDGWRSIGTLPGDTQQLHSFKEVMNRVYGKLGEQS